MTEFRVDERSLDVAAERLDALQLAVPKAEDYVTEHLGLGYRDSGLSILLLPVLGAAHLARQDVMQALGEVRQHLDAASTELQATVDSYRNTDRSVATVLDTRC